MLLRERGRSRIGMKRIHGRCALDCNRCPVLQSDRPMWTVNASSTQNQLLLIASEVGIPLCTGNHHTWDMCTSPTLCKPTSTGGESKMMPQESIGSAVTQCPASKTSLGWINGSYNFFCGCPLEHPLKMGEDLG